MKTSNKALACALSLTLFFSCTKENIKTAGNEAVSISSAEKSTAAFTIGQQYQGGIIFYIDNTGSHGLVAATVDQGTGISWRNTSNIVTNATGTAVGTGLSNTNTIVNAQGTIGSYAALLCYNYKKAGFKDWYLPSKDELNLLYQQRAVVGGLGSTNYWSSSEANKGKAWDQEFGGGFQFKDTKSFTLNVRAIHSF